MHPFIHQSSRDLESSNSLLNMAPFQLLGATSCLFALLILKWSTSCTEAFVVEYFGNSLKNNQALVSEPAEIKTRAISENVGGFLGDKMLDYFLTR